MRDFDQTTVLNDVLIAFSDVMDGTSVDDLHSMTGIPRDRCIKIKQLAEDLEDESMLHHLLTKS